jgi:hypothetical protein
MDAERAVLAVAARQHGVVSGAQFERAGLSTAWVKHRVARGWLRRLHRGVYLVGAVEAPHTAAMAAFLACGAGALVAHYAGAVLWDWRPARDDAIDVIVPGRKTRPREGIRTHRAAIHPNDITRRHGVPVTSAARTLLDLAAGLPQPEVNAPLEGFEVDLLWRAEKLVVEVDGHALHSMRRSFERDRHRDQALTGEGWRVLRVTWRQLTETPEALVATLTRAPAAPP